MRRRRTCSGLRRLNPASITCTLPRYGHWVLLDRTLWWRVPTQACAGRIMRLSLTIEVGTAWLRITITIGTTRYILAVAFAVLTRLSHAMIALMVRTPPVRWSVMTAWVTRSVWRPAQSGLVAATWIRATAHRPDTSSACNGSWRLPGLAAATPTPPRRRTSLIIPGSARLRKVVRLVPCKLPWNLKLWLVS